MTNGAIIRDYRQWLIDCGRAETTLTTYLGHVRRLAHWLEEHQNVALLDAERPHLRAWRSQLVGEVRSILGNITAARSFYHWATLLERMDRNPTLGLPVPKAPRSIPRPISDESMDYAIEQASGRTRQWLVLEGYAGMRACEISTLHRGRIFENDDEPHMIVISKGGGERVVWLSPYVWSEIKPTMPRRGYVYLRRDRTDHVSAHTVTQMQNRHLRACGLDDTAHALRHRFGTRTQRTGKDLRLTQEMMGHADPKTTSGYAATSNPDAMRVVMAIQPKGWRDGLRAVADAPWPGTEDPGTR